jgi:hypothetical protein
VATLGHWIERDESGRAFKKDAAFALRSFILSSTPLPRNELELFRNKIFHMSNL